MLRLNYDLHIHSCLSPCGDADMTPANIVGMAKVLNLDVIALTDHNSCKNCPAALSFGEKYGVTVLSGMELTTREEVHVLCLFPALEEAMAFDAYVHERLLPFPNREEIFGQQLICGPDDEVIGKEERLLIGSTDISFDEAYEVIGRFGGLMIPAHIDRSSNSLLHNLGFVPPDSRFSCAEVADMELLPQLLEAHPYLQSCRIVHGSDAHYLEHIQEAGQVLCAASRRAEDILEALKCRGKTTKTS